MSVLTIKAIPHILIKDLTVLEAEKKELIREAYELFKFILAVSPSVEMVFSANARLDLKAVRLDYYLPCEHLKLMSLTQNLRYFKFDFLESKQMGLEETLSKELSIYRKIRFIRVGGNIPFYDEIDVMPLMKNFNPNRTFLIPLTQRIELLNANYKWKNILATLAQTGGRLYVKVQKIVPKTFEVNYANQGLNYYKHTYEGKLSPAEVETNTKTYQAIISKEEAFRVNIYVKGNNPDALRLAFLRDLDVNAFDLKETYSGSPELECIDPEAQNFIKKLQHLWSQDEVIELLLTPPYTCQDALSGIAHFVPKPFLAPFVDSHTNQKNCLLLGQLDNKRAVNLLVPRITQHIFVTGTCGSGKTNTVHHLLAQLQETVPLLIIDPAKREYENLMKDWGKADKIIDFKNGNFLHFNPFIAPPNITVYSHSAILAKTLAILFPTNEVAFELILNMVRETYIQKLRQLSPKKKVSLEDFLKVDGNFFRANPTCIPSFDEFLAIGIAWLKKAVGEDNRWGQEAVQHFERRWAFLERSMFKYIFSSHEPADKYFESDYLIELYNILDPNESNALFAMLVALLFEYRLSQGLQDSLKHLTVLEEAHRIIPAKQPGLGENLVSSPAHEASKLLAQMLAEIRALGEGVIVVDQSPSKIIPDVLINSSTKIVHRILYGVDKQCLSEALSLSPRESEYLSYLATGEAIGLIADTYQPLYLTVPKSSSGKRD